MQITAVTPPLHNQLVEDYWAQDSPIHAFFTYKYNAEAYKERLAYLETKHYERAQLVAIMREAMSVYALSPKVEHHLQQLKEGAYAIVGGQQAGVLTGPLYSVHKAITVIQLAKQQSEALGVPVVPVFWIAGEDHDIEEINHTYTRTATGIHKRKYKDRFIEKTMATTTEVTEEKLTQLIHAIIADFGEQFYTKEIEQHLRQAAAESTTFTSFFTYLWHHLFNEQGLLWIDAANPKLRQLEAPYFERIIEAAPTIAKQVTAQEARLDKAGYGTPLFANADAANLFYVKKGARYLLTQTEEGFTTGEEHFTKAQLLAIARENPEALSNNVVTRPVMQEMVLPVLAFVGGPGELAYWAALRPAFETLGLQMPIFAPRLHLTLVTPGVQKQLKLLDLTVGDIFTKTYEQQKQAYIESTQPTEALAQIEEAKRMLQDNYKQLMPLMPATLQGLTEKNEALHLRQFAYLQRKIENDALARHDGQLKKYAYVANEILPNDGLQERVYNPYQYIAICGTDWIRELCERQLQTSYKHYVVYL